MDSPKVGFVGLGNIGLPMAKSIARRQFPLTIYGRHEDVIHEMESLGATRANSPEEMAAGADVVISVVRDIVQTEDVIFGDGGIWNGIRPGAILVISSTIGPDYCQQLYARAKQRGVHVVDAALSKSGPSNKEGRFTLMVGGDDDAVERCRPIFDAIAMHVFHLGGIGMGQTYKLINQLAQRSTFAITCEYLNLGLKAGLDLEQMIEVMRASTADSAQLRSLQYRIALNNIPPATQGRDREYVNDLVLGLARENAARTPLFKSLCEVDLASTYDAYSDVIASYQAST